MLRRTFLKACFGTVLAPSIDLLGKANAVSALLVKPANGQGFVYECTSVKFRKYSMLSVSTTPLVEGITPSWGRLKIQDA